MSARLFQLLVARSTWAALRARAIFRGGWDASGARKRLAALRDPRVCNRAATLDGGSVLGAKPRLVFLLSPERSGSTVLSLSLGASPRHIVPPEMHMLAYPTFEDWYREYPDAIESLRFLLRACSLDPAGADLHRMFEGFTPGSIYQWILNERLPRGCVLIDKTPKYARDPRVLQRLEALRPHYIWLVRHPLGVAASQIELRRSRRNRRASGIAGRARLSFAGIRDRLTLGAVVQAEVDYWCRLNLNIESLLAEVSPARWVRVSYERFATRPDAALRELSDWLGSPFDEAMLTPGEHVPSVMTPETGDPKIRARRAIDPTPAYSWRERLGERHLEPRVRELMRRWEVPDEAAIAGRPLPLSARPAVIPPASGGRVAA